MLYLFSLSSSCGMRNAVYSSSMAAMERQTIHSLRFIVNISTPAKPTQWHQRFAAPQSLDDKVLAIIPISHHLYIAEHHRTHCVYKRSKIPTGYLQYCTKQQQPGTCHKYYIIKILHCSKRKHPHLVSSSDTSHGLFSPKPRDCWSTLSASRYPPHIAFCIFYFTI